MTLFYKIIGVVLVAVVLGLVLKRQGQDITLLLGLCVCCIVLMAMVSYIEPVLDFIEHLQSISNIDPQLLEVILKAVGIGLIAEIAMLVCTDSGNAALGKAIQLASIGLILWLSLPLMKSLLELVERIAGEA